MIEEDCKGNILGIVYCLILLRRLSLELNSVSCTELIRSGIVLYLEKYTDKNIDSFPEIEVEACWIIANISAHENQDLSFIFNTRIAHNLVALLKSQNKEVFFNVIWALSNISGESLDYRNKLLLLGDIIDTIIGAIIRLKNKQDAFYDQQTLGEVIWLVSNLCRGKPYPPYDEVLIFNI